MLSTIIVILIGIALTMVAQLPLSNKEIKWLWLAFVAHILGAFAIIWITRDVYGYGDLLSYFRLGNDVANYVSSDFRAFPELLKAILHIKTNLPFALVASANSTSAMIAFTALLILFIGKSIYAVSLVYSLLSFSGSFATYLVFRRVFPPAYRARLAIVSMLFPSFIFWTSSILKEALAIFGLGWLFFGAYRWISKRYLIGSFFIVLGGTFVGISKAYILFPFAVSFGAWIFWRKAVAEKSSIIAKPIYILLGVTIAIGGIIVLGNLFPRYSPEQLMESTTTLQGYGTDIQGGSSYQLIDPSNNSLTAQVLSAPLALASSLFRPFFFEVHNALAAINALETTALTLLILFIFIKRKLSDILSLVRSSPTLIFCIVFILTFGTGVGLATTNLGTLSRYRIPMLPFYGALVMTLLPLNLFKRSKAK